MIPVVLRSVCVWAWSYLTLCDSMGCSPPGSSKHGIFQARILKWVVISYSRGSSQPRDWNYVTYVFYIAGGSLPTEYIKVQFSSVKLLNCVRLCDPLDCSTSGFPVHHQLPDLAQTHVHWVRDAITLQFKSKHSSVLSFLYSPTLTSIHDYWKNHNFD